MISECGVHSLLCYGDRRLNPCARLKSDEVRCCSVRNANDFATEQNRAPWRWLGTGGGLFTWKGRLGFTLKPDAHDTDSM